MGDEKVEISKDLGLANVMSRILYNHSNPLDKSHKNPVLSKTTTPLQKKLQEIQKEEETIKEKRKKRREDNLQAMHIPTKNEVEEIQREREYRRIATRGVVALFNAITKHQQKDEPENDDVNTKRKFLEKLKQTAMAGTTNDAVFEKTKKVQNNTGENTSSTKTGKGWKALQDD